MSDRLKVCLGYPLLLQDSFRERLRIIDPSIELLEMPIDEGGNWIAVSPGDPHPEPPSWASGFGAERRAALAEAEVLIALHEAVEADASAEARTLDAEIIALYGEMARARRLDLPPMSAT